MDRLLRHSLFVFSSKLRKEAFGRGDPTEKEN
jgi:hypothetical protein